MLFTATVRLAKGRALLSPIEGALVLDALQSLRREGLAQLHAFAVLPDQVALLLSANDVSALSHAMTVWEKFATRQIGQLRGERGPLWAAEPNVESIADRQHAEHELLQLLALPVKAGLAPSAAAYALCSAHPDRARRVDPLP